jgi:DNA-binding NtrC family response regulator
MTQILYPANPVLIVDDEEAIIHGYRETLTGAGISNLICCTDSREALKVIAKHDIEAVILDLTMPHISGEELLEKIVLTQPDVPVLVISGKNDIDSAITCMKIGAHDYLIKPVTCARILSATQIILDVRALHRETQSLRRKLRDADIKNSENFSGIITGNEQMKSIFAYIDAISGTPHPILITGETGVGKERFAQAIHQSSQRQGEFVAVNVAGLDDNTFSDTLFGHKKGAYTGANTSRPGLIQTAAGGTLFLDEIGDLSPTSQVKLLRLLQEQEYLPLGQDLPEKSDARIIVATNADLAEKQRDGGFRPDLFYRLNTHMIRIPPLRDRMDDLAILVDHFMETASKVIGRKRPTPPKELIPILMGYHYPGNVRELEAMITDAVSRHTSHILSTQSIKAHIAAGSSCNSTPSSFPTESSFFSDVLPKYHEIRGMLIDEALKRTDNNHTRAAEMLSVSRQVIWRHVNSKKENNE